MSSVLDFVDVNTVRVAYTAHDLVDQVNVSIADMYMYHYMCTHISMNRYVLCAALFGCAICFVYPPRARGTLWQRRLSVHPRVAAHAGTTQSLSPAAK